MDAVFRLARSGEITALDLASAGNIDGGTWNADLRAGVDGRDGAGSADFTRAMAIADQKKDVDNVASKHGWAVGTIVSSQVPNLGDVSSKLYYAKPDSTGTLKVALSWSVPFGAGATPTENLRIDFDLVVADETGKAVVSSASWDNNLEIVEFHATANKTYKIQSKCYFRDAASFDRSYSGVAWTSG
jgi:hypothetical protein